MIRFTSLNGALSRNTTSVHFLPIFSSLGSEAAPPTFEVGEKKIKAILIFGKKEEKERSVGATFNAFSVSRPLLMVVPVVIFFRLQQQCFMEIFYRYILRSNLEGAFFSEFLQS